MIEKRINNLSFPLKTLPTSPSAKENTILIAPVTHVAKSPTRYIRTSVHQSEITPTLHPSQWASTTHPITTRVGSPQSVLSTIGNCKRPDFIELGGSREKRDSLHRESEPARKVQASSDTLLRKVVMLEGRVKELHLEKQMAVAELSQRVNRLQLENDNLAVLVHNYKKQEVESGEFSELNLEEMLSTQININLELREENERIAQELKVQTGKSNELYSKMCQIQAQKDDLVAQLQAKLNCMTSEKQQSVLHSQVLEAKIFQLDQTIAEMEQSKIHRENSIKQMVEEKEKHILELEEQIYSLSSTAEKREKQVVELEAELSSVTLSHVHAKDQLEQLKTRSAQKQQCKKCKELLHTVFRLNCQLNKK